MVGSASWNFAEDGKTAIHIDLDELEVTAALIARHSESFRTRDEADDMLRQVINDVVRPLLQKPEHPSYNMATGGAVMKAVRASDGIHVSIRPWWGQTVPDPREAP